MNASRSQPCGTPKSVATEAPPSAAETIFGCALILAATHERYYGAELNACVVHEVRRAAKRVTGGNMTFADADLAVLEHLAVRAVDADLLDGLRPSVAAKAREMSEQRAADAARSASPLTPAELGPGSTQ